MMSTPSTIVTPDRRLRIFVSSTLEELAEERAAVHRAVTRLHLVPVMFEAGARSHPPRAVYRAYLEQSDVFVGIYWERYGWIAPDMAISGLEDEYLLSADKPRLVYVKRTRGAREERLDQLLRNVRDDDAESYKPFSTAGELERLVSDDLAVLLTERFEATKPVGSPAETQRLPLPSETTSFVGRAAELAEIVKLLTTDGARCVTLTGPGGIGKTRLALHAARQLEDSFAHGVCFVPLADVRDEVGLPAAVAARLGLRDTGPRPLLTALTDHLARLEMLIVLDGFERLVDASAVVVELLEQARSVKLLATSRFALRILAEHEMPVPALSVGPRHADDAELAGSEAVQLFVERASAVRHGFTGLDDLDTIAAICRRLDGLPLAIELAAATVRLLPPKRLLDRLARRLDLPVAAPRDVPNRHRTLRDAIASSFELCTPHEQRLLARMAVFAGGCTLDAAEAVCAPDGDIDVLETAGALAEKSLLQTRATPDDVRFGMFETVRDFGLEVLAAAGECELIGRRHADYYRDLASALDRGLRGPDGAEWLSRLGDGATQSGDAGNLRTALHWFIEHHLGEEAATMVWTLWLPTWLAGSLDEGCVTVRRVLTDAGPMSELSRARVLGTLGFFDVFKGEYNEGLPALNQALELARREHDDLVVAYVLLPLGVIATPVQGEEHGRELLRESFTLFAEQGDLWGQAATLSALGWIAVALGEHDDDQLFTDAIAAAERAGDVLFTAMSQNNAADHELALGNIEVAKRHLRASLEGYDRIRASYASAYGLDCAAGIAECGGDEKLAATLTGAADGMRDRMGVPVYGSARGRRDAFLTMLRQGLGTDAFEAAWSTGHALGFHEAIDLALAGLQDLRSGTAGQIH